MQPVEGQRTVVGEPREIVDAVEPPAITGGTQGAAPRPIKAEEQTFGEPPVHTGLQRMVIRSSAELVQDNVPEPRVASQEVGVKGLRARVRPRWTRAAGELRAILILRQEGHTVRDGIQISSLQFVAVLRSHIRCIPNENARELCLPAAMGAFTGRNETIVNETVLSH